MTPDVNVLVAAYRTDHSHHSAAEAWLRSARRDCARGTETLCLLPMVATGFMRLVTNPRVFAEPDTSKAAVTFIDALIESPGVDFRPATNEWPLLRSQLLDLQLRGNLVTDAWVAASVQALGEHLVTFDRDFLRLLPARDLTVLARGSR